MDFFSKLKSSSKVTLLCGASVLADEAATGKTRRFSFRPVELERKVSKADYGLLAVHYYSHILARYPRNNQLLDPFGMKLRQMVADIIEQGVWPDSNLLDYAGLEDQVKMVGPEQELKGQAVHAVLFRSLMGDDLDLALEMPSKPDEELLTLSVIVMLQGTVDMLEERDIELLDKALRYFRTYIGEGADYASPLAARNLANRAFREAGGKAV